MNQLETWFRDFFLSSYLPQWGRRDEVEVGKLKLWTTRLLSISWYLSSVSLLIWIVGISSIHLTKHMPQTTIIDKIFFYASPTTWDKYFLTNGGGLFDSFRRSTGVGENTFICSGILIVLISLACLIFSLSNISISTKEGLKELKNISLCLCFPVFGSIAASFLLIHFVILRNYNGITDKLRRIPIISNLLNSYLQIFIKKEEKNLKKANFVDISFLESSKKLKESY